MNQKQLQTALNRGGTIHLDGVVRIGRTLVVKRPSRIEGGVLLGDADRALIDVRAELTIVGTEVARTGGYGHCIQTRAPLTLEKVIVSGGRSWALEGARRAPMPAEFVGAGVVVEQTGRLHASGLVVSGCTGAGVTAHGPVRWTRGRAHTCRRGVHVTAGDTVLSSVRFEACGVGVRHDGFGTLTTRSCRFDGCTLGAVLCGAGAARLKKGVMRGCAEAGVLAHVIADVVVDGVDVAEDTALVACGTSTITARKLATEPPARTHDLGVIEGLPSHAHPTDTEAMLRPLIRPALPAVRLMLLRRAFARTGTVDHLVSAEHLIVHWGDPAFDWIAHPSRTVLWSTHLDGAHRIAVDARDRIWFSSSTSLITDGLRITPGGACLVAGEHLVLGRGGSVVALDLDGREVASHPLPSEARGLSWLRLDGDVVRGAYSAGERMDQYGRWFTWNIADGTWEESDRGLDPPPRRSAPSWLTDLPPVADAVRVGDRTGVLLHNGVGFVVRRGS